MNRGGETQFAGTSADLQGWFVVGWHIRAVDGVGTTNQGRRGSATMARGSIPQVRRSRGVRHMVVVSSSVCVCVYIYKYKYIKRERERERWELRLLGTKG